MEDYLQIDVRRNVANNLKFPSRCAFCLEATPAPRYVKVKHNELKGYELHVPHCETHLRMIRYMKLVHYGTLGFALLVSAIVGRYLHNHRVFVIGFTGFNYIVAGFLCLVIWLPTYFVLQFILLWQFDAKGSIDRKGAVEIAGVRPDGFVLLFHNRTFGREFTQLNYSTLMER